MNAAGRSMPWWLGPAAPVTLLSGVTLLVSVRIPAERYEQAWRVAKAIDPTSAATLLAGVAALLTGLLVALLCERDRRARPSGGWPGLSNEAIASLRRLYPLLIGVTLLGYVVWIANGLSRGLTIDDVRTVLATQDNFKLPVKEKLETLPGITTLTQVAIPACIVGVIVDLHRPSAWVRWAYRLVVVVAMARALMLAERLAVAELAVPILVLRAAAASQRLGGARRRLLALAPVLGLAVLVVGFGASEYSRSWNWYDDNRDQSFAAFSTERLLGYYATSHNNGALLLDHGEPLGAIPYYSTAFIWEVPPGDRLAPAVADSASDDRGRVLGDFGNPEFNSPSGWASVFVDFGTGGGVIFFFLAGLLIGGLHLSFVHGRSPGLLLYPIFYTALLELARYTYWSQGRSTPALVVSVGLAAYLGARARRAVRRGRVLAAQRRPSMGVA